MNTSTNTAADTQADKPDLGLLYRRNGCETQASVCFLGLEIASIERRAIDEFTVTLDMPGGRRSAARTLTLDFNLETLDQLLAGMTPGDRAQVLAALAGPARRERISLPRLIVTRLIECLPGQSRKVGNGDMVVPFSVLRVEADIGIMPA
jgi:hypothetical protein